MSNEFRREYLIRLPLPLAQLYCRAHNAKDGRGRHDNCFYLFGSLIKLAGSPLAAAYIEELREGGEHVEALDRLLVQLALPSLGQWCGILRETARYFGERDDADSHPLGHVWKQLNEKRRDLDGMLELYRRIKNGPEGKPSGDKSCSLIQLIDVMVTYRNAVFGHGAGRAQSFYEEQMGPLMFAAVNDVLADGVFDLLGPKGSQLVLLTEVATDNGEANVELRELLGLQSERAAPISVDSEFAERIEPDRLAIVWPGRAKPLLLDPLLAYRESEISEDVLFLNRDRNRKQVEFLSYATGETSRDKEMSPTMNAMMELIVGKKEKDEAAAADTDASEDRESEAGDYELLAELGRGGMGVVYLARQLSLGRLVALKMLPTDLQGNETAVLRFRREMRALGHCEHPNIVKVIACGTMPGGALYYAMEYVPGTDLEQLWIESAGTHQDVSIADLTSASWSAALTTASSKMRSQTAERTKAGLASRVGLGDTTKADSATPPRQVVPKIDAVDELLPPLPETAPADEDRGGYQRRVARMIRDAASALEAVHAQGLVHRDVKPANLMLTADGKRVVLMDFGLAKQEGQSSEVSAAAGFLGTLRYSAPEQLDAATKKVGPQADIRGLGITMWELLTRRKLFAECEDEGQLTRAVAERDVPRLRTIDPAFDRDLEAIVSRATEREVDNRVATARDLATYLDLYLEGKPLPIRTPGLGEFVWRWIKHHKAIVGTAASAALAVVVTVVVSFILITQSRNNERLAKVEALRQRDRAEHNFAMARDAVERYFTRVSEDTLLNEPGMHALRNELLADALDFNKQFVAEHRDDPELQDELARAFFNLGRINDDIGRRQEAIGHFLESRSLYETRTATKPDDVASMTGLASTWNAIGRAHHKSGEAEQALAAYRRTIEIRTDVVRLAPDNTEFVRLLANAVMNAGEVQRLSGDLPSARKRMEEAQQLRRDQLDYDADDLKLRRDFGMGAYNLANLSVDEEELDRAKEYLSTATATFSKLSESHADAIEYQHRLAFCYRLQGDAEEEIADAIRAYASARERFDGLVMNNPLVGRFRLELARTEIELGGLQFDNASLDRAAEHYRQAVKGLDFLLTRQPDAPIYRENMARALQDLASVHLEVDEIDAAQENLAESIALWSGLAREFPGDDFYEEALSDTKALAATISKSDNRQ